LETRLKNKLINL